MIRKVLLYFFLIGGMLLMLYLLLRQGSHLELEKLAQIERATEHTFQQLPKTSLGIIHSISEHFVSHLESWLSRLILQILVIIAFSRAFSYVARKIGQPTVIGEIAAGIILGPSFVGYFFPEFSQLLFPESSLMNLNVLSQFGLILFMFIIGMEVDIKIFSNRAQDGLLISHSAIVITFFLGATLAFFLYNDFAPHNTGFIPFALFMGVAMSITAFPVLARIIQERGITKTYLGSMAITCAAIDDVTAWCILAIVIAIVKATGVTGVIITLIIALVYIFLMLTVVRSFLSRLGDIFDTKENLHKGIIALIFVMLLTSAFFAELIGIHALFGAFLAGAIMPQNLQFKRVFTEKIEDLALVLLLPLFFVTTGLRTEIGLLNSWHLWSICLLIIFTATLGKMGGVTIISKFLGLSWKNALSMGALMNARGLMELVVLNIAYDLGILSKELFAIMVLMALFTTALTGPLLNFYDKIFKKDVATGNILLKGRFNILLSFGPAKMGKTLIGLAKYFTENKEESNITALHITPQSDISPQEAVLFERSSFAPVKQKADELNINLITKYLVSQDVEKAIKKTLEESNYDLLLVGGAKPLFNEKVLGGKIKNILEASNCDVAILSDKNFSNLQNILILADSVTEEYVLNYGLLLASNSKSTTTIINTNLKNEHPDYYSKAVVSFKEKHPSPVSLLENRKLDEAFLDTFDLIIVSDNYWNNFIEFLATEIRNNYSYLIFHKKTE
jgi:Kef-type K+ transport system membrane component KefB